VLNKCSDYRFTSVARLEQGASTNGDFAQSAITSVRSSRPVPSGLKSVISSERIPTAFMGATSNSDGMRTEQIHQMDIEFIPSNEFDLMFTAKLYPKFIPLAPSEKSKSTRTSVQGENLACLAPALNEPLLSPAEEQHLFRGMNFLKFAAARLRESLNPHRPAETRMDQIEECLAESKASRDQIIRANLRLVISNASKYCTAQYSFEDLVSDGTLALMEAVDKFDYQRGFRFSTYATHAIRRSFFGKIERKQRDRQRFAVTDPEIMMSTPDRSEAEDDTQTQNQLMAQIVNRLSEHLTERELLIIEGRFGLNGRSEPKTLVELSDELGICKERVRQVEGNALKKLHAIAVGKNPRSRNLQTQYGIGN
jgi:RNA polymerase primary sigma factor